MNRKIFVAGATGAIGAVLVPLLVEAGYIVYGGTRRLDRASALEAQGAHPVVVDVFDAAALDAALKRISPWGVVHQLTDLPQNLDPKLMAEAVVRNARLRIEGTRNLVAAARGAGAQLLVAQSIAWVYAPGAKPFTEEMPLDQDPESPRRISADAVISLERSVLGAGGMAGTVLRYGQLYGPGTSSAEPRGASPVHVEAAAWAAVLALRHAAAGIFNIAEDNAEVSSERAKRELEWNATWRVPQGASR